MIQFFKRLFMDSNVNINLLTLKLMGALAKGLRKNFSQSARGQADVLIQKLKDTNRRISEETFKVFEDFYYSIGYSSRKYGIENLYL